jgi:hypothetical protein
MFERQKRLTIGEGGASLLARAALLAPGDAEGLVKFLPQAYKGFRTNDAWVALHGCA